MSNGLVANQAVPTPSLLAMQPDVLICVGVHIVENYYSCGTIKQFVL